MEAGLQSKEWPTSVATQEEEDAIRTDVVCSLAIAWSIR